MIHKRGYVLSAEFAPRLVIHPDGSEDNGAALASSLAYLDARHTLRLSVWDILEDELLRSAATAVAIPTQQFTVPVADRTDMIHWYGQGLDYEDPGVLFQKYRPTLLDALVSE